ncbi:IS66 family transposase [Phaeodactylibacter xiamenensis]|uniref:IS66 family transposase n=1 Tax=Phaeodactylibacter xiamenensis TaxID=1524460 RepID=UPI003CCBDE20
MEPSALNNLLSKLPPDISQVVRVIVSMQQEAISQRDETIRALEQRIKELEAQLNQNSRNSSRPPSSDGPKKSRTTTQKSKKGRKPGGQPGHKGTTLKMVPSAEAKIEDHYPKACSGCGADLSGQPSLGFDRRQVFDIPPIEIQVTEHRAHRASCSCCGVRTQGLFPAEATNNAVYGPNLRTFASYCMSYQLLPYGRTAELLSDFLGQPISEGTLDNMLSEACCQLDSFSEQIIRRFQQEEVAGFDETGVRAQGQAYAHVASGSAHTYFFLGKRGYATMDEMGILPGFKGIAVHDRYANYFGYDCQHSLCNAHLLRNLQAVIDEHNDYWARQLQELLKNINKAVKRAKAQGKDAFSSSHCAQYRQRYMTWVQQGLKLHPAVNGDGTKGPPKQTKTHNLLMALKEYASEVLRFLYDFRVPFDNNRAERDIRMLKVKMKISGFFHSIETGNRFLRIRAFLSTATKQGYSAFEAMKKLFTGQTEPFVSNLVWGD